MDEATPEKKPARPCTADNSVSLSNNGSDLGELLTYLRALRPEELRVLSPHLRFPSHRDPLARQSLTSSVSVHFPQGSLLPAHQSSPQISRVDTNRVADVVKGKPIRFVAVENPLFRITIQSLFPRLSGCQMVLKTEHGILENREHEQLFGLQMKPSSVGRE